MADVKGTLNYICCAMHTFTAGARLLVFVAEEYIYVVFILFENSNVLTEKEDSCLLYKKILHLMSGGIV